MGYDWHHLAFLSEGSWMNADRHRELTEQERCDLAWCEYADALRGEEDFNGPALGACFNLVLKRYGLKPTHPAQKEGD